MDSIMQEVDSPVPDKIWNQSQFSCVLIGDKTANCKQVSVFSPFCWVQKGVTLQNVEEGMIKPWKKRWCTSISLLALQPLHSQLLHLLAVPIVEFGEAAGARRDGAFQGCSSSPGRHWWSPHPISPITNHRAVPRVCTAFPGHTGRRCLNKAVSQGNWWSTPCDSILLGTLRDELHLILQALLSREGDRHGWGTWWRWW